MQWFLRVRQTRLAKRQQALLQPCNTRAVVSQSRPSRQLCLKSPGCNHLSRRRGLTRLARGLPSRAAGRPRASTSSFCAPQRAGARWCYTLCQNLCNLTATTPVKTCIPSHLLSGYVLTNYKQEVKVTHGCTPGFLFHGYTTRSRRRSRDGAR